MRAVEGLEEDSVFNGLEFRRLRSTETRGQIALFDSIMFFLVMLLASYILLLVTSLSSQNQDVQSQHAMSVYAEDCRDSLMKSTICRTWFQDMNNNVIWLPPGSTTVQDLLLLELSLRDDGISWGNFKGTRTQTYGGAPFYGVEESINVTARSLVRAGYQFAVSASYKNESSGNTFEVMIAASDIPSERVASSWTTSLSNFHKIGDVQMSFYLWGI